MFFPSLSSGQLVVVLRIIPMERISIAFEDVDARYTIGPP